MRKLKGITTHISKLSRWVRRHSRSSVGLAAFGLVLLVVVGLILWLWVVPIWRISSTTTEIELVKTLAQIALGALVLVTLYLTWRRVEVAQEGQITERFTRAIKQLGSDNIAVRLGGIYALERIAKDSKKDHWQVMEVLTAYVRENTRRDRQLEDQQSNQRVPVDIQAIVTVLGRRNVQYESSGQALNLTYAILRGADFYGADIAGVNFAGANLAEVNFSKAILTKARFIGATLREANFTQAVLREACFGMLEDVDDKNHIVFVDTDVTNARFSGADIRDADLSTAINLTQKQISSAGKRDETTKLPNWLTGEQNP